MYDETDRTDVTIENRFLLLEKAASASSPIQTHLLERMIMLAAEDEFS
ncbi:MAG: hypothetical protein R3C28_23000 [Pirellulaceae bacterium]